MSRNGGGEAGFEHAEDGGIRARLGGRDVDILESRSQSSKTDVGCTTDDSLEIGLEGTRCGECPRRCGLGILPMGEYIVVRVAVVLCFGKTESQWGQAAELASTGWCG